MIRAGCKRKDWQLVNNVYKYRWIAEGTLLANGVCIKTDYTKSVVPEKGRTKIFSTIENAKLRAIDAKAETVSIDFTLTIRWLDPNIKANFSIKDRINGGIALSTDAIAEIWTPDLYILNRRSFKIREEWASLKRATILTTNAFNTLDTTTNAKNPSTKTTVEMKFEIKSTVYCNFDHSAYPMDNQTCNLRFGSGSFGAIFSLYNPNNLPHDVVSPDFKMSITFFDEKINHGNNTIGINIKMNRILNSFIFEYYIPCIAIALVSEISFVIPITAIPGRVALLVTLFLTLTNLFIHQMVSENVQFTFIYCSRNLDQNASNSF